MPLADIMDWEEEHYLVSSHSLDGGFSTYSRLHLAVAHSPVPTGRPARNIAQPRCIATAL